jgi:hypothetical protein
MVGQSCLSIGRMWESDREWPELQPPKSSKLLGEGGFLVRGQSEVRQARQKCTVIIISQAKKKEKKRGDCCRGPPNHFQGVAIEGTRMASNFVRGPNA